MPSTVISNFFYNTQSGSLRVIFISGAVYEYKHVPESVFLGLKKSTSKGTYLNEKIKGNYDFEKLR